MSVLPARMFVHYIRACHAWRSEEGVRSLEAGVTGGCEPPHYCCFGEKLSSRGVCVKWFSVTRIEELKCVVCLWPHAESLMRLLFWVQGSGGCVTNGDPEDSSMSKLERSYILVKPK